MFKKWDFKAPAVIFLVLSSKHSFAVLAAFSLWFYVCIFLCANVHVASEVVMVMSHDKMRIQYSQPT